jgi:hypothetical protein
MKPEIASLLGMMGQSGDWRSFRDEIAALHAEATTEEEYVTLLEAHRNLVTIGKFAFDEETYNKILPVVAGEYKLFLNNEAMEDGIINPVLLERVTRREVDAGRLDPEDSLRTLAVSGAAVLGDSTELTTHVCRRGDWFFYGIAVAAVLSAGLSLIPFSPLWLIVLGLVVGWSLNERERKRIKKSIGARRF